MKLTTISPDAHPKSEPPSIKGFLGILLVDKPVTWSSHDVVNWVRRQTGEKRVGHAGTLDPLASGLLIVLVGREHTKRQDEFLKQDKEYECTAQLGITTDTYDSTGQILKRTEWELLEKITHEEVVLALTNFQGSQQQTVPAYSAVKVQGERLYRLARKAEVDKVTLPTRQVTVHSFALTSFDKNTTDQEIFCTFTIHCSSGTYIRSLIHDLGQRLGVGATVTALRRTKIGSLSL